MPKKLYNLSDQCLDRRLPDIETISCEVNAWQARRNAEKAQIR